MPRVTEVSSLSKGPLTFELCFSGGEQAAFHSGWTQCQTSMRGFHNGDSRALRQAGTPLVYVGPALPGVQRRSQRSQGALIPEEQQYSLWESLEVVVPVYLRSIHHGDLPEHLQSADKQDTSVSSARCPATSPVSPASHPDPIPFQLCSLQAASDLKPGTQDSFHGTLLSVQKPGRQFLSSKH